VTYSAKNQRKEAKIELTSTETKDVFLYKDNNDIGIR